MQNMDTDISNILLAINKLYNSDADKDQASKYLSSIQTSTNAWDYANKLLALNHSTEVSYFGAQTLKQKIQTAFNELPQELYQPLEESLYGYINQFCNQNNTILNQLCLALADLILRLPNLDASIGLLFSKFNDKEMESILLEVLTDLIEELNGRKLRLGYNKRNEISIRLGLHSKLVLSKLDSICSRISLETHGLKDDTSTRLASPTLTKVLKCLELWVEQRLIEPEDLSKSAAFLTCLEVLQSSSSLNHVNNAPSPVEDGFEVSVYEKASDVLVAVMICIEDPSIHPELSQYLITRISLMAEPYQSCVRYNDEIEKAISYCSIFTELGNLCLSSMVNTPGQGFGVLEILELLLSCVRHPEHEVSEITFNFWYNFAECLYNHTKVTENKEKLSFFRPYVNRLLQELFDLVKLDPELEGIPNHKDDIGEFRIRVFELIQDLAFASEPTAIVTEMLRYIENQLSHTPTDTSQGAWVSVEAALFLVSALVREIGKSDMGVPTKSTLDSPILPETNLIPAILNTMFNSADQVWRRPAALRNTCIEIVSETGDWLKSRPAYLDPCMKFLFGILETTQCNTLRLASLRAINNLCLSCKGPQTVSYLPKLLTLAGHRVETADSSFECPTLDHPCRQELIKAICIILPYLKDQTAITQCLTVICEKLIQGLLHEVNSINTDPSCDPSPWLDQISALFKPFTVYKASTVPAILVPLIQKIWPVLSQLFLAFQSNEDRTEKVCRTCKHMLRAVGKEGGTFLLSPLVGTILTLYQSRHHSSYLYLGGVVMEEFNSDSAYVPGLLEMFENFTTQTMALIFTKSGGSTSPQLLPDPNSPGTSSEQLWNSMDRTQILSGLRQIPDNVEDYFRLCRKFVKYLPVTFMGSHRFADVFHIFIIACYLDHREAHSAAMGFMCDLISVCSSAGTETEEEFKRRRLLLANLLADQGQVIVNSLVESSIFHLSAQLYPEVADLLYELMVCDKNMATVWMENSLRLIQQQAISHLLTASPEAVSNENLHEFQKAILNATQEKQITRAFREFARLFK